MSAENTLAGHLSRKSASKKPRKPSWQVRLGEIEWRKYTYERPTESNLHLLGSVRKGLQCGALGRTSDWQYVLIVGDHETPLNAGQIQKVLPKSALKFDVAPLIRQIKSATTPPVVIVKKRRFVVPA
ncbi:MAG: hypothetical protein WCG34_10525 [Leptolinea sp.]